MPRTIILAHLGSHQAVEVGDKLAIPGGSPGIVGVIDTSIKEMALDFSNGRLTMSFDSAGVVWMDSIFVRPRPNEPIDHLNPG